MGQLYEVRNCLRWIFRRKKHFEPGPEFNQTSGTNSNVTCINRMKGVEEGEVALTFKSLRCQDCEASRSNAMAGSLD